MSSLRRRTVSVGALIAVAASLLLLNATSAHAQDPAADAAAALAVQHVYVSPEARAAGVPADVADVAGLPDTVRVAVLTDGNAGQIAADISSRLGASDTNKLTVGVVIVGDSSVAAFNAVSTVGYCKGGADLAARDALDGLDQSGGTPAVADLLQHYAHQLSTLPPDRGESSCASALAHGSTHDARAWLWWLVGVLSGLVLIGALALYSSRVVAARRAAGEVEEPATDELPDWIARAENENENENEADPEADPENEAEAEAENENENEDEGGKDENTEADAEHSDGRT